MALQAEIIPFTIPSPAGPASLTVNHIRYPSSAAQGVLFICASDSGTSGNVYGYGVDDGTHHIGSAVGLSAAFGVPLTARGFSTLYSIITTQAQAFFGGAETRLQGYISAIHVGSFDLTFPLNNTPGAEWFAIVFSGDGVEAAAGFYDVSAGPGDVDVGFDPVAVFKINAPDAGSSSEVSGANAHYGFAVPCDDNQVGWGIACSGNADSSYQLDGKVQADITAGSTVTTNEVTLSAWITDGFSLSFSGTPLWNIGYLAIGGTAVSANLVPIIQPTSTGVQTTSITASNPVIAFFSSTTKVATSGQGSVDANLAFGVYDGVSNMSQWWGCLNTSSPFARARLSSTTKAITLATANGPSTSILGAAASCTLSAGQISLNWTTADSFAREVWALVLAQNLTGSPNNCGDNPQASITVIKHCTPIAGGETEFPFSSAGLTPTSFTLMDGESQLFSSVSPGTYDISETAPAGWTATYAVSNGDSHDAITVTGTEAITVTTTNTFNTTTPTFRIYRRFALPYDEHYFTYLNRLEIVAQMGVGNGAEPNPTIRIRFSKDGGSTFGDFRTMSLGAAAQYTKRAYINRVGRGRDLVAELICDDPVVVAWVQCLVEGEKATGTN